MKRYNIEQGNWRLLETDSFEEFKNRLRSELVKRDNDLSDLKLFTSDYEGRCSDVDCTCREQLGFNEAEIAELEEMEIYV